MSPALRGNLRMALSSVRSSRWRSFLTMLGVIVGIVAVVTVVGLGEGVQNQVTGTVDRFGSNLIVVRPLRTSAGTIPTALGQTDVLFGMATTVDLSNADVPVVKHAPGVGLSAPLGVVPGVMSVGGKPMDGINVLGTSADLPTLLDQQLKYGDFWTSSEASDQSDQYAVVGQRAAEALFGERAPLGMSFVFRGQTFRVRGVFSAFPEVPFSPTASFDDAVFIPYQAAARITNNAAGPYVILAKPNGQNSVDTTIASIQNRLTTAHGGERDFSVMRSRDSLKSSNGIIHLLSVWIIAVAAISLLMGGVGIMNIMLLVVTERMHEIGVRKAVGATRKQILAQFMLEAMVLSLVGGAIGILVSLGAVGLLRLYTDLRPIVSWTAVGIATFVSISLGIVFGSVPALKAASKDPIEALRHE